MPSPSFIYGTAWKENKTERLTRLAIEAGFRAIDTANQRRHYLEAGVGAAVATAVADGLVTRDDLFLQTKFTYVDGQDHRLPYDPDAPPSTQVEQSFASSLEHLQTDWIDCYVLHGPRSRRGLDDIDLEVWQTMEHLHSAGKARALGISNVALDQLEQLWDTAKVRPAYVQNRCFARTGWDFRVREFCRRNGIVYEGFSLLTANVNELQREEFWQIVERTRATPAQVVFRFAMQAGMLPITGTTDPEHMREDLAAPSIELTAEEIAAMERTAV